MDIKTCFHCTQGTRVKIIQETGKTMKHAMQSNALLILAAAAAFAGCGIVFHQKETDRKAEITLLEKAIHGSIGWAKNKDLRLLYSIIADDSSYLEVDPGNEIVSGIGQFRKNEAFWMHPDFKAVRYDIRDLRINLSRSGDVAWFYCVLDDVNEWKGRPANWMNTRWTGVLEKRDKNWRMVQMHFSFARD
jgi:ketosteroid isomerase-like protein